MAFDFNNTDRKPAQSSGFRFGDDAGNGSAQNEAHDTGSSVQNRGFAQTLTTTSGGARNNLQSYAEQVDTEPRPVQRRRMHPVSGGRRRTASRRSANIPWRFLIIAALVIAAIVLIAVYWDVILAFLMEVLTVVIIGAIGLACFRSMLRSR